MNRHLLWAITILALAIPLQAQFESGSVLGTVRDPAKAPVPGAVIELHNVDTGVVATTVTGPEWRLPFSQRTARALRIDR